MRAVCVTAGRLVPQVFIAVDPTNGNGAGIARRKEDPSPRVSRSGHHRNLRVLSITQGITECYEWSQWGRRAQIDWCDEVAELRFDLDARVNQNVMAGI